MVTRYPIEIATPHSAVWLWGQLRITEEGAEPVRTPLPETDDDGERAWLVLEDEHGRVITVHADCTVTWDGDRERLLRCIEALHTSIWPTPTKATGGRDNVGHEVGA